VLHASEAHSCNKLWTVCLQHGAECAGLHSVDLCCSVTASAYVEMVAKIRGKCDLCPENEPIAASNPSLVAGQRWLGMLERGGVTSGASIGRSLLVSLNLVPCVA
jgi:hypothetical protein